jgi:Saccharopine dehydrogenase NADP binding domain
MTERSILIAAGYGVVGQRIAAELAPDYQVIVAGRHLEQAQATAAAIGHGARGREIDVTVEASIAAALDGIATVVSCIDQPRRRLLRAAIERGLRYTDITPHLVELGRGAAYEEIAATARASGARVVLGTGIVPGISNVIVRGIAGSLGGADEIETSLLLSASDVAGPASFDYLLKELTTIRALTRSRPHHAPTEDTRFVLRVDVIHDGRSAHATLVGGAQADAAAAGASGTVRALMEGEVFAAGAWMPEQVIDPPHFLSHLAKHGLTVELPAIDDNPHSASG